MKKPITTKLGLILLVMLVLLIIIEIISGTVSDRQFFRDEATRKIASSWTGAQELLGPVIRLPYTLEWQIERWTSDGEKQTHTQRSSKIAYLVPKTLIQQVEVTSEFRSKGIFDVPVYAASIHFEGLFNLDTQIEQAHPEAKVTLGQPSLSIGIRDARGLTHTSSLQWGGDTMTFEAGSNLNYLPQGLHAPVNWDGETSEITFSATYSIRGLESLLFQPSAKKFELEMLADWPHPALTGNFLPIKREISSKGFQASWSTNEFSSVAYQTIEACGQECLLTPQSALGVDFILPVDIYDKTDRSLKYAILFVSLLFVAFFIFETLSGLPIHPIQYGLVGLAICTFYLLLLSLTEHLSFVYAYSAGAFACLCLIGFYLRSILNSRTAALGFTLWLGVIYALLYVIVSAEDFALLMGSSLLFAMLAILMITTRQVDWYGLDFAATRFGQPEDS
jgi:inner membrane protein